MNQVLRWLLGSDPAEMVGKGNWRFGFVAEYGNYVNLALIVVFVAMVYLIARSYRREGNNPAGAKAFLSCLRIGVCLLVLAVLFRPAVILRFARTLYSTVLVVIDDSRSMSFKDRYADANQAAALAEELGVPSAELEELSRTDVVRRLLGRPGGVTARLGRDHPLSFLRFSTDSPGQESYTRPLGRLAGQADDAPAGADTPTTAPAGIEGILARLTASGYETNLPAALRDSIESVLGRRVAGIVLISDGQATTQDGRDRLADAVAYANQRGLRLYPVLVGDPTPPKNVAVTGLQAPREVRRGARTELVVSLAHRNLAGQSVTVKVLRRAQDKNQWTDTGLAKTVVLNGKPAPGEDPAEGAERSKGVQAVAISMEPDQLGEFVYRAVVEPRPDERNPNDNSAEANVTVSDEKIKVLLVSGDAGWEFQYVRNFLLRQPDLYRLSVWQQNADKELNQIASTGMKLDRLPRELAQLAGSPGGKPHPGYDVVILYDPQPTVEGFDETFVDMLRAFVQRHGGGLCYVAGNKYSAAVLRSRGPYEVLSAMLPVVLGANTSDIVERIGRQRPQPWPVRLTSYGTDHPITRFGGSAEESVQIWNALPGIYWSHPVLKVKPLARVLAVSSNPLRRTSSNEPEPLLVAQPYGMGRVLYCGFDDTWRWRYIREGYYHRLFWSNVVRYLATLQARHVVITAGGDRFPAGERIALEVEAYDENFNPLKQDTFDVEMIDLSTGEGETIKLQAVADKPGRYKATIRASRTGTFELTALKGDPMAAEKVQSKTIRVELPKAEDLRPEADRATMQNLASRPQNFLPVHEIDRLAELIPADRKTAVREVPWELWDSNLTLLLIVLLLGVEWVFRKKYNMA
ncbi:MAG TPA: vWA domain-containing protein [Phycisphaerae bacterium]|nr:vWA domain-containing protein [Phycisphaerae bacterium]